MPGYQENPKGAIPGWEMPVREAEDTQATSPSSKLFLGQGWNNASLIASCGFLERQLVQLACRTSAFCTMDDCALGSVLSRMSHFPALTSCLLD